MLLQCGVPWSLMTCVFAHSQDLSGPSTQLVNHFSSIHHLTSKTGLLRYAKATMACPHLAAEGVWEA